MNLAFAAAAAAAAIASAAQAAPQVGAAWSRPAAQGTTGAGFMTLSTHGAKPDAPVSAQSPTAGHAVATPNQTLPPSLCSRLATQWSWS